MARTHSKEGALPVKPGMVVAALGLVGCAFAPGQGFATLGGGRVDVTLGLAAGQAGRFVTTDGYELQFAKGSPAVLLAATEVQVPPAPAAGEGEAAPAEEASGDPGASAPTEPSPATVMTLMPTTATTWVVLGTGMGSAILGSPSPGRYLDLGDLADVKLTLQRFGGSGQVWRRPPGAPLAVGAVSWQLDLPLGPLQLVTPVHASVVRGQPMSWRLDGKLALPAGVFARIEWPRLVAQAHGAPVDLGADPATRALLLDVVTHCTWTPTLGKSS
ncbi:MAG: hypothetical protein JWM80_3993 [Cyanobacteria bacterium RYN_339]|nr:hypothetical protein [Cyanobacteria bacterium RYN_339]